MNEYVIEDGIPSPAAAIVAFLWALGRPALAPFMPVIAAVEEAARNE